MSINKKNKDQKNKNTTKKEIIVLGDIEMGAGNLTDDFIADNTLAKLILNYAQKKNPVDLVLNGDTFDFLKCPYTLKPKPLYTPYITAQVALSKVKLVAQAHSLLFEALKEFAAQENKMLYFVRGNHDFELAFPEVQREIKKCIGQNVTFPGLFYDNGEVYIEHGHQYDPFNRRSQIFTGYKNKKIINNPFVPTMIINAFIQLKEEHPFLERIKPVPVLFSTYPPIQKKVNRRLASYIAKSLLYHPLRNFRDSLHNSKEFLKDVFSHIISKGMEVPEIIQPFKTAHPTREGIIILGHIHEERIEKSEKNIIIHPGPWRDEYILDPSTRKLTPKRKKYVHITMQESSEPHWKIQTFPSKRCILDFDDVVKNEKEYLKRAAEEEKQK